MDALDAHHCALAPTCLVWSWVWTYQIGIPTSRPDTVHAPKAEGFSSSSGILGDASSGLVAAVSTFSTNAVHGSMNPAWPWWRMSRDTTKSGAAVTRANDAPKRRKMAHVRPTARRSMESLYDLALGSTPMAVSSREHHGTGCRALNARS